MQKQTRGGYDPNAIHHNTTISPDAENFDDLLMQYRPREAAVQQQFAMDRRTFMKLMGGSLALAGFGAAGCTARPSEEQIIPYVRTPEEVVPGKPLFFASAMTMGGYATGVLIETHAGRPTRIDGNPAHPASRGASTPFMQGSILELYNPDRKVEVRQGGAARSLDDFKAALGSVGDGSGIRILTQAVTSPTLIAQIEALTEQFPGSKWYQYEPAARNNVVLGSQLAFDEVVNTVYQFEAADVVLSIDADFLYGMPGSLHYAREFTARRKIRGDVAGASMNRLYAVESSPSLTGATADHRLALTPSQVEAFAKAVAAALDVEGGAEASEAPWSGAWFDALIQDLRDNAGSSLVIAGDEQSPAVHALVHAINDALGNVGATVTYTAAVNPQAGDQYAQLAELVSELENLDVNALFIIDGNPAYDAPADIPFAEAISRAPFSVHLSLYNDETSQLCDWFVPMTHFIEAWSDARAFDGSLSVVQPPISPLYADAMSAHELLAALMGDERSGYEIVRATWEENYSGDDFEAFWRRTLHNGVAEDSAAESASPSLRGDFATALEEQAALASDGLELIVRPDPHIWDGRFANNPWLLELPRPFTKLVWDNAALISPTTASELELENEDLVELSLGDQSMVAPVWVTPGHANGAVTVFLGFGRGIAADVADGKSFNAYALVNSASPWHASGLRVNKRNEKYELASARGKINLDELGEQYSESPVRAATLAEFVANPDWVNQGQIDEVVSLYPEVDYSEGYSWGMSIDLSACVGCNACVIACQAENNIPSVGKENVRKAREMHWLRVDRYYEEEADGNVRSHFQPLPCMHCETAPCETVCPVEATVHDSEGLNTMVYNRCIGTRYCSANCPYTVRRFNYLSYIPVDSILTEQRNPNVSVRPEGVMEKCTYCVQRISSARITANNEGRAILDGEVMPACAAACPAQAISFGNLNDPSARVVDDKAQPHSYGVLAELGTKPRTTYLAKITNPNDAIAEEEE